MENAQISIEKINNLPKTSMRQKTSKGSQWGKQTLWTRRPWAREKRIPKQKFQNCGRNKPLNKEKKWSKSAYWCKKKSGPKTQKKKPKTWNPRKVTRNWGENLSKGIWTKFNNNQNHKNPRKVTRTKEKTCFKIKGYKLPKFGKISSLMEDQQHKTKTHNNGENNIS